MPALDIERQGSIAEYFNYLKWAACALAALWLFEMVARVLGYGTAGYYNTDVLLLCALFVPIMAAGSWTGEKLGNRISQESFSKLMALLLMLTGASLLGK